MEGEQRVSGDEMEVRRVGVGNNESVGVGVPESENRRVQQQVQGPAVRWDRFLPFRSLKVLLVENDECTRHVVSALLKNCSYEVVAVANGVQAWRYLEDLTNHTDLILTEVVMPVISGISLLNKIMNHKTIKNIPVIMMSSHDSMGIVFKCLSRGAVDFLVKPIRKNELKNLWQHVWRRCQSSSGSGSESGTESRKSVRSKVRDALDNSNRSNRHEYQRADSSSDDDNEYESDAQSSWTKRAAEIGSPQPTEDDANDAPDSTCAQVIHTKADVVNGMENVNVPEESEEQRENFGYCKDQLLEQGISERCLLENQTEGQNKLPEQDFSAKQNSEDQHAGRINTTITSLNMDLEGNTTEASNAVTEFSNTDNVKLGPTELPFLELGSEKERYSCGPTLFLDSQKDSLVAAEAMQRKLSHSSSSLLQLASGFIDKNNGNTSSKLETCVNEVETSTSQNAGDTGKNNCTVQPLKIEKVGDVAIEIQVQPRESQQVHVEHHHHYHHYHHHIHDVQHHQALTNQDHCSFENPETVAVPCASSHAFTETGEGAAGNFSMNGSGSGSQHGSNGKDVSQHGSNEQNVMTNTNNDDGVAGNSADDNVKVNIITNRPEEDQFFQREASLIKSRQKRKERSFEKKVRIQGRRKIADQRTCEREGEVEGDTMLDELAFKDLSAENVG